MQRQTFTRKVIILILLFLNIGIAFSEIPLGIQATKMTICSGSEVVLYAIGGTANRRWQPGGETGQFITVRPTQTTTYTLTSDNTSANFTITVCNEIDCEQNDESTFNPFLLSTGNNGLTSVLPGGILIGIGK